MIKEKNQSWLSFTIEMVVLISLVLFIRFYIFQFFRVSGPSMCPTINQIDEECLRSKGEFIFVNEFLYNFKRDPKRGEVAVFNPPTDNKAFIKRIIGVPGDIITIESGKVYLENENQEKIELDEYYISDDSQGNVNTSLNKFTVPKDHYLLFGDNRTHSLDARYCFSQYSRCSQGDSPYIRKDAIIGKASFVIWPIWRARPLENGLISIENNS